MARVEADLDVTRFAYEGGDGGTRLLFPRAQARKVEGRAGATTYGAADCAFEELEGRFGSLRWAAGSASAGSAWLKDDGARYDLAIDRAEFPHGLMLTRGVEHSVEIVSPHVTFSELRMKISGPFGRAKTPEEQEPAKRPSGPLNPSRRQEQLRFLDSLSGRIYLTIKVQLDLPVVGVRSLDQQLRVPIQEGSLDYRALDEGLDWLEGTFLDIKHEDQRLKVQWKVPIVGAGRDLITWALDNEASTLASFGRVPVRSLADFRIGSGQKATKSSSVLRAFSLEAIDIALSLLAPRHLEVGHGTIMFGGDDQPGMVDLKVVGAVRDRGAGKLTGTVGSVDTTIKDLKLGSTMLSADRLHFDGIDTLEVTFDGFSPTGVNLVVHRVTATNLAIKIGEKSAPTAAEAAPPSIPASPTGRTPRQ